MKKLNEAILYIKKNKAIVKSIAAFPYIVDALLSEVGIRTSPVGKSAARRLVEFYRALPFKRGLAQRMAAGICTVSG